MPHKKLTLLELVKGPGLRPQPTPNPNSLYVGKPVAYHVTQSVQICTSCRSYHSSSQTMLEVVGPRFKIFRRVPRFEYNLPIYVNHHAAEEVPACAGCATMMSLAHLPPPPVAPNPTPSDVRSRWREEKRDEKKKQVTLEDLL